VRRNLYVKEERRETFSPPALSPNNAIFSNNKLHIINDVDKTNLALLGKFFIAASAYTKKVVSTCVTKIAIVTFVLVTRQQYYFYF